MWTRVLNITLVAIVALLVLLLGALISELSGAGIQIAGAKLLGYSLPAVAASIFASVFCLVFLIRRNEPPDSPREWMEGALQPSVDNLRSEIEEVVSRTLENLGRVHRRAADTEELVKAVNEVLERRKPEIFNFILRNDDLQLDYWCNLLESEHAQSEPLWLTGTKLSPWLNYNKPKQTLARVLASRCTRHDETDIREPTAHIYITKRDQRERWLDFVRSDVCRRCERADSCPRVGNPNNLELCLVNENEMLYAVTIAGRRIAVTPYVRQGVIEDSPTFEVAHDSTVGSMYLDDLLRKRRSARNDRFYPPR